MEVGRRWRCGYHSLRRNRGGDVDDVHEGGGMGVVVWVMFMMEEGLRW